MPLPARVRPSRPYQTWPVRLALLFMSMIRETGNLSKPPVESQGNLFLFWGMIAKRSFHRYNTDDYGNQDTPG